MRVVGDSKLNKLSDDLTSVQFATDFDASRRALEQHVSRYAKNLYDNGSAGGNVDPGKPFNDWWRSCCELLAPRQISISRVQYECNCNDIANADSEEYIDIINSGPMIVDLSGWRLKGGINGQDVRFPDDTLIKPDTRIRIHTHKKGAFSFNSRRAVWDHQGDQALLFNRQGMVISSWLYGDKAHAEVVIAEVEFADEGKLDDHVVINNIGNSWIDIANWQLSTGKDQCYIFPFGTVLAPNQNLRVNLNEQDHDSQGYDYKNNRMRWNYCLDSSVLRDHNGHTVATFTYGEAA